MSTHTARRWVLASRPAGLPAVSNFRLETVSLPDLTEGQILYRVAFLSVDPYVRGRLRNVRSYVPPLEIGDMIEGAVVGEVLESSHTSLKKGDAITGLGGWTDRAVAGGDAFRKIEKDEARWPHYLGVLGMPGMTAYFALKEIGHPKAGETVLISGAAGAVGSAAGQIAKISGCQIAGIAGSDEKVRFLLDECGFDRAINYKTAAPLRRALKEACPAGIDVYFDNVGGEVSDAAITRINLRSRIIICGQISIANREQTEMGPRNLLYLLINRARMEGFLVRDYEDRFDEGVAQMRQWLDDGRLHARYTIAAGLESAPEAFIGLFTGANIGKQLVRVS